MFQTANQESNVLRYGKTCESYIMEIFVAHVVINILAKDYMTSERQGAPRVNLEIGRDSVRSSFFVFV